MTAPFTIRSIGFAFAGNPGLIPLRDPATQRFLGDPPEWDAAAPDQAKPAGFVRGSRPQVQVWFGRDPTTGPVPGTCWRIGARGSEGPGIAEQELTLEFDATGRSGPHRFTLDAPLPPRIGVCRPAWSWYAASPGGDASLAITRHEFLLAWRPPIAPAVWATLQEPRDGPPDDPAAAWTWLPILRWTSEWAADQDDEERICDAIFAGLPSSGLRYAVAAWNVLAMLQKGGGYCGGWFRLFQAMAGAHGITLDRRFMAVDWREESDQQARWCAIVVEAPGLNRNEPEEDASAFHDCDERPLGTSPVRTRHQRRYRFWGSPGKVFDGHCLNFLRSRGRWILYDPSFLIRAELTGFTLPPSDRSRRVPVEALGDFKEQYLDRAMRFMLGSLHHGHRLYRTIHPDPNAPDFHAGRTRNGLTVETALIEKRDAVITFYWL